MKVRSSLPLTVCTSGRNSLVYTSTSPEAARACASVSPTDASGGCVKTAVGTLS
jgi:hypothetical protein